ncbi:hypothetical protein [Natronomonas sp. EA1]|uniref:hypothetical protein n=1 Tax=Natronomonas sp. EA1 TaxID=3421655 RepID=UPI003EB6FD86
MIRGRTETVLLVWLVATVVTVALTPAVAAATAPDTPVLDTSTTPSTTASLSSSLGSPAETPQTAVHVAREGDTLRYTVTVETAGADALWLYVDPDVTVVETDGVQALDGHRVPTYRATGETTRIVVERELPRAPRTTTGAEYLATDDWALGPVPYLRVTWQTDGHTETTAPFEDGRITTEDPAAVGEKFLLYGDHEIYSRTANGQTFHLVAPAGTGLDAPAVLDTYASVSARLAVGDRDTAVRVFALPPPARGGGEAFIRSDEAWVNAGSPMDSANNVWIHEYVHTRQEFRLTGEMAWFTEASAEYYAARLAYEEGHISQAEYEAYVSRPGFEGAALGDRDTWASQRVPYVAGVRTLAELDERIRDSSGGERSLDDVFRMMNEHEGEVSYEEFTTFVARAAGEDHSAWLDERVQAGDGSNTPFPFDGPVDSPARALSDAIYAGRGVLPGVLALAGLAAGPLLFGYRRRE